MKRSTAAVPPGRDRLSGRFSVPSDPSWTLWPPWSCTPMRNRSMGASEGPSFLADSSGAPTRLPRGGTGRTPSSRSTIPTPGSGTSWLGCGGAPGASPRKETVSRAIWGWQPCGPTSVGGLPTGHARRLPWRSESPPDRSASRSSWPGARIGAHSASAQAPEPRPMIHTVVGHFHPLYSSGHSCVDCRPFGK